MTPGPAIPDGINVTTGMGSLLIRRSWFSWKVLPLLLFVIAWDSFLFFWYGMAFSNAGTPWLMIVFPIGHLAVGVGLTYYVVSCFVNSTALEISANRVSVKTGPIPWFSNRDICTHEIRALRVKYSNSNNNSATYEIRYRTSENREKKLISDLTDDQAEYIEYQLREILGLKNAEPMQA